MMSSHEDDERNESHASRIVASFLNRIKRNIVVYYFLHILIVYSVAFLDMRDHLSYSKYFYKKLYILLCLVLLVKKFKM
jgi:hypothetical protein